MKNSFIIGDVHGCLQTLQALLTNWNKENDQLIFVGDLIDRGNFSPETVAFVRALQKDFSDTIVLMGNHEYKAFKYYANRKTNWFNGMGDLTLAQYKKGNFNFEKDALWFETLPLTWENEFLFVSHAGICDVKDALNKDNYEYGVLWNRNTLKKMNKIQVHGHTPVHEGPIYNELSNSWNIDTGCVYNNKLTALHFNIQTQEIIFYTEYVHLDDVF